MYSTLAKQQTRNLETSVVRWYVYEDTWPGVNEGAAV